MTRKILLKDLRRGKAVTATLFSFILLSALLVSSSAGIITGLLGSLDSLFTASGAPHFVQMHSGEIDQEAIDTFASGHQWVQDWQTVEMLNINGAHLYLGDNALSEAGSVMENSFVTQNHRFDFLLDLNNQIAQVADGEIGVPVYHMQQYGLREGDKVEVAAHGFSKTFTITAFVRDVQMNPSIVTSKRFLVSANDWNELYGAMGEVEYLIEFQLSEAAMAGDFESQYHASGLPQKDTAITYSLYRLLNSLSDGIVAAVVVLVAVLLILIAALCLRFTMIAAIEEDYREIGVMKAIGISSRDIRRLYLAKYIAVAACACVCGYLLSLPVGKLFTANMALYMGGGQTTLSGHLLGMAGAALVFAAIVLFCRQVLGRFRRISAVEAMRSGASPDAVRGGARQRLSRSNFPYVNVYLGVGEVLGQFRVYGLLCFVYFICAFLMIVPLNLYSTICSPTFITYMGAGQSDIRIDLQQTADITRRYEELTGAVGADPEVERYAAFVTRSFQAVGPDGNTEALKVEIGDFSVFPLLYSGGRAPQTEGEIALSVMNARELEKDVGDTLALLVDGGERELTVCGIYQDVTNGGKTAKALLPCREENALWYVVYMDVAPGVDIGAKTAEYAAAFYPAKVTDMEDYVSQTMGSVLGQLRVLAALGLALSLCIAMLITAMFFKMQVAKDRRQVAIMRSIGFSGRHIRTQYITRALSVLLLGVLLGTAAAGTVGQRLAGLLLSGVSSLRFVSNPLVSYLLCPLLLAGVVAVTVLCSSNAVKKASVINVNWE